jgi:hypothetical protein
MDPMGIFAWVPRSRRLCIAFRSEKGFSERTHGRGRIDTDDQQGGTPYAHTEGIILGTHLSIGISRGACSVGRRGSGRAGALMRRRALASQSVGVMVGCRV